MKPNPILEEIWRIKNELSRQMAADPDTYFTSLDEIAVAEEKAGRKIVRSTDELRQLAAQKESNWVGASAMALNDKPAQK